MFLKAPRQLTTFSATCIEASEITDRSSVFHFQREEPVFKKKLSFRIDLKLPETLSQQNKVETYHDGVLGESLPYILYGFNKMF